MGKQSEAVPFKSPSIPSATRSSVLQRTTISCRPIAHQDMIDSECVTNCRRHFGPHEHAPAALVRHPPGRLPARTSALHIMPSTPATSASVVSRARARVGATPARGCLDSSAGYPRFFSSPWPWRGARRRSPARRYARAGLTRARRRGGPWTRHGGVGCPRGGWTRSGASAPSTPGPRRRAAPGRVKNQTSARRFSLVMLRSRTCHQLSSLRAARAGSWRRRAARRRRVS